MKITITGQPGSGKSTVAKLLAERLGWKHYNMGKIRREYARKQKITIDELNKIAEKDPTSDFLVDNYLESLANKKEDAILEGRTAFFFIPKSIKIYLDVEKKEAARRIFEEEMKNKESRNEKRGGTIEQTRKTIQERIESDKYRYKKLYNINPYAKENYDLLIDTSRMKKEEVVKKIINILKEKIK
ncbi:cytidylate kinase family protein [Candidatus Woesearchaeota archaeon]|nr:cytidylate kinase family protein [Candidatus Woesearchaeota archaeon]